MAPTVLESTTFEVGWICALSTEFVAACELLDEEYAVQDLDYKIDENTYVFGRIGQHRVVIACLPKGRYGLTSAGVVARDMLRSFPSIRFGLMVGIGGGAPSKEHDIRLGDIVVGCPSGTSGGVMNIQYGKNIQGRNFIQAGSLNPPPRILLSALNNLIAKHERNGHDIQNIIGRILANPRLAARYESPGWQHDHLFNSKYLHQKDGLDCEDCCMGSLRALVQRSPRDAGSDDPMVHYGIIASSDSLMKNAEVRDAMAKSPNNVLCFEMEAAGLMDHYPCLVIRGICDYSDTHKNKNWQGYAAAVAAAYAKELLSVVASGEPVQKPSTVPPKQYHDLFAWKISNTSCPVDIIAVHGLGGDAVATWKTADGYSWPRQWLSKCSDASLLTYGYDSAVTWSGKKSAICDTALDLLKVLWKKRSGKKFVFMCHGLGGIIVKLALVLALSHPEYANMHDNVLGLIFLGTPQAHLQSHEWMTIIYRMSNVLLRGKPYRMAIMEQVETLSSTLNSLSFEYPFDPKQIAVLSYYETVPGTDTGTLIVEPEAVIMASAKEQVLPLKSDHAAMAAPDPVTLAAPEKQYNLITELIADLASNKESLTTTTDLPQKLYCVDYEIFSVSVPDASPRTGVWLWDQYSFKAWVMSKDSQLFWVKGLPGYGKTVIAKNLTRDLKTCTDVNHGLQELYGCTTVVFFFREETQTSTTMVTFLRSLLHQLLLRFPALGPQIQQAFDTYDYVESSGRQGEPHLLAPALWRALRSVLHNKLLNKVVLIVDALDEADPNDIEKICEGLLRTLESVPAPNRLKIFLTSRNNYSIFKHLGKSSDDIVQSLEITSEHTSKDIEIFLDNVVTDFSEEHNVPEEAKNRIKQEIVEKADGMFLWASLAWDHFKGGVAVWSKGIVQERLEALMSLPPGLYELYVKMLQKIDERVLQGLHAVFLVVAAAARPITCEEIEQMLGIKGWEMRTSDLDIPFSIRGTINRYCPDLLKIGPSGVIRMVHLSLKDFIREVVLKQVASSMHSKIARDCIHYLTLADVREEAQKDVQRSHSESCLMRRFPLYDYAATYLGYHMNHVEVDDHIWLQYAAMTKHYSGFHVAASSRHFLHVNTLSLSPPSYYLRTPLLQAMRLHGTALIRSFAQMGYDLNEKVYDSFGTYVRNAETAIHNYIKRHDIVSELLDCGASPNIPDYFERTPLHEAIRLGCRPTTKLLLSIKDINLNAQDVEGRTPLHYEATSGHGSLLLNDPRVNVNLRDKSGRTAITTAAFWGDHETTLDFLRSRRNVLAQHEGELSILITTAQQDWLAITLNILEQLPDVSSHRGYDGKTILHWAVINDWEQVLLHAINKAHAKVNDVDKRLRTPLHEAGELGNSRLARKLIAHGASCRYRDHQGRTPIQLAAIEGFSDTVLSLMDSDFDISDADKQQRTLVHWAASWDWTIIMRRVIEVPEVNFLKHDEKGRTALHIAALCGCPNVLQLLVDESVFNVNETDSFGNSLLHLAARARSTSVVDVLMNMSSFIRTHAVNNYGQTALDVAMAYGADEVSKRLQKVPLRMQKVTVSDKEFYRHNEPDPSYHTDWVLARITSEALQRPTTSRSSSPLPPSPPSEQSSSARESKFAPRPGRTLLHVEDVLPETLDHYGLPWKRHESDENLFVVTQKFTREETDELFEHSERLMKRRRKYAYRDRK